MNLKLAGMEHQYQINYFHSSDKIVNGRRTMKRLEDFKVIGYIAVDALECQILQMKFPQSIKSPSILVDTAGRIVYSSQEAELLGINRKMTPSQAFHICPDLWVFEKPKPSNKDYKKETRKVNWGIMRTILQYCCYKDENKGITVVNKENGQWSLDLTKYIEKIIINGKSPRGPSLISKLLDQEWKNVYLESELRFQNEITIKEGVKVSSLEYLDLNYIQDKDALIVGGAILNEIIQHIIFATGFNCSGGAATNEIQAKVACMYHKPKSVTILTEEGLNRISREISIRNIPGLEGQLGDKVATALPKVKSMFILSQFKIDDLKKVLTDEEANTVYKLAGGQC